MTNIPRNKNHHVVCIGSLLSRRYKTNKELTGERTREMVLGTMEDSSNTKSVK